MPNPPAKQKLCCYVDETGQDDASSIFIVVAVISIAEQEQLREALMQIERESGTEGRKWHKSNATRRLRYIALALEKGIGAGDVFFGSYQKPLPYFFPMLEVLEDGIKKRATSPYSARVFVDGIDKKKSSELTNALRLRGISLEMVRGRRDKSEPVIRLPICGRAVSGAPLPALPRNKRMSRKRWRQDISYLI
jgi:hypothetical protein